MDMVLSKGSLKTGFTRFQAADEFQAANEFSGCLSSPQKQTARNLTLFMGYCLAVQTFHPNHHHRRGNGFLRFNFRNRCFDVLFNG